MSDRSRLTTDPDFILAPKHQNSLERFLEDQESRKPKPDAEGVPPAVARMLGMSRERAEEARDEALEKLRGEMPARR